MPALTWLLFLSGLALLILGAEALVRGASRLAASVGISPLVIGLTIVAYGTGSPELAVSLRSIAGGSPDLAVGNVVGSNIFNILIVLGVSALVVPLAVHHTVVRREVPIMIACSLLALLLAIDGRLTRLDGIVLLGGGVVYTWLQLRVADGHAASNKEARAPGGRRRIAGQVALILAGLGLLVLGSRWLVTGAVALAETFGASELVIGLTVVAAGTSLPEVATSVVAALRGERDIAVGNAVGSSIFNILIVLGATSVLARGGVHVSEAVLAFDMPVMIAASLACLPIFFTGHRIARWEGGMFVGYYIAYTVYLILQAGHHASLPAFSRIMFAFVIPLTTATLIILTARAYRREGFDSGRGNR